jgi:ribosomal-protein-alanine N-acetyltransferase
MTFRSYQPGDLDAMHALDVLCFAPPFRFSRSAMRRFAEARKARVVIAEDAAELAGFCILHVERARAKPAGYIVTLDVAPPHRRRGLATQLMQRAEQQALEAGCAALALHVFADNEAAMLFYKSLGFIPAHTEHGFYGDGLDALLCVKPLHAGSPPAVLSAA